MTKSTRNSIAIKFAVAVIAILLAVCLVLQFVSAPSSVSGGNTSAKNDITVSSNINGVKVSYNEVPSSGAVSDYALSDKNVESVKPEPKSDELVTVIVSLGGTPMMEYAGKRNMTVAEAMSSKAGANHLVTLKSIRTAAEGSLSKYIVERRYTYSTVLNGFSAKVRYGDVAAMESNPNVKQVIISDTYLAPAAVTENKVDVYETGIFDSSAIGFDGTGTVVAVLDTGTDYTHEVFDMELDLATMAMTKDDVASAVSELAATSMSADKGDSIDEDDLYLSTKLPYAYDYADSDANVYPFSTHGTHVAGIIAGKSDRITGVAPRAQIATFKVFSDDDNGAPSEAILAALNDAVVLGVDAINMSLGTSCGFSREDDDDAINAVYDAVNDNGICLVVAASNDYSSAQGSTWGNTNLSTNPDSGTVGSPASYEASLAVASISGVKTKYFTVNGTEVYFGESRVLGAQDSNDFVAGLLGDKAEGEYEYRVIPGIGLSVDYTDIDIAGKIAVVKRGNTSFEEKIRVAKDKGAVGVIVYNNISGTLSMSVGAKEVLPSCFVTMDFAETLLATKSGKIKLSKDYLAGPFMSDFSSWGVLPDLQLSPDITAHGGEILSSVVGKDQYDKLSGTSMAAPNLAGALILVRQYVKEKHPEYSASSVRDESYSRMMSTATMVLNEAGNPYSPRKQGAGLANMANSVNTKVFLTVDGSNKPKLSLGDDPERTGVYSLVFNVVNTSGSPVSYNIRPYVMTESMSSDGRTVAERAHMFDDTVNKYSVVASKGKASVNGSSLSLGGYGEATVTVDITLSEADKKYIDDNFMNGMYVEGYVRLESYNADGIDLGIPFLGFYGDWTDAPMLDVSEYEVGESAADDSILADEKLVADQYGTIPFAGFYSAGNKDNIGYWGMGAYSYILPEGYATPVTREQYASLTTNKDGNYLLYMISAGLLRSAKKVEMEIRDSSTGELVWSGVDYNARKTHGSGEQVGGNVMIELDISELGLANNSKYTFSMECFLDKKDENGEYTYGKRNTFSFEFTVDNEAPEYVDISVRETKSGNNKRYYLDLTVYDNHYLQGYSLSTYTDKTWNDDYEYWQYNNSMSLTSNCVLPIDSEYNGNTTFSIDVTSYWSTLMSEANDGKLHLTVIDYAKNTSEIEINIEREDDLQISKTRSATAQFPIVPNGQIDLLDYVVVRANVAGEEDGAYVEGYWTEDLVWESLDPDIASVNNGIVTGIKEGTANIIVRTPDATFPDGKDWADTEKCLRFVIAVSGTPTTIKLSGIELSAGALTLSRGETATITATIEPYNFDGEYKLVWSSTSSNVKVLETSADGLTVTVQAMQSGGATVRATVEGTRISGFCSVRVREEFEMSNNIYLRRYNGRGDENGVVEIPKDLGVTYISRGAFVGNEYIKKVIIPEGTMTVMENAFMQCSALEEVVLPSTVETIEQLGFYNCANLKKINLENVKTIGYGTFWLDRKLENVRLDKCTFIGDYAFLFCDSMTELDLSRVGFIGGGAFGLCAGLERLVIPTQVNMGYNSEYEEERGWYAGSFFGCSNLKEATVFADSVGDSAFYACTSLTSVSFMNDVKRIGDRAFLGCSALSDVNYVGTVYEIGVAAYLGSGLRTAKIPAGLTILGQEAFADSSRITSIDISADARLTSLDFGAFYGTNVAAFNVGSGNKFLSSRDGVLYDKAGLKLIAYPWNKRGVSFTVPAGVKTIGSSAFSRVSNLKSVDLSGVEYIESLAFAGINDSPSSIALVTGYDNVKYIGDGAFMNAQMLGNLPVGDKTEYIGDLAFVNCVSLNTAFVVPASMTYIGGDAFNSAAITSVSFANSSMTNDLRDELGAGAFANTRKLDSIDFGKLEVLADGMFAGCTGLTATVVPSTVKQLGAGLFEGCSALTSATLPSTIKAIPAAAFSGTALSSVTIPDSVTELGADAFAQTALTSVDLKNVVTIGDRAFYKVALASVASDKVKSIGSYAFAEGSALASASFANAETIGDYAFYGNSVLGSVSVGAAKHVGARAFAMCPAIKSLSLGKAETIGEGAFYGDTALASLDISNAESIADLAFVGTQITSLDLSANLEKTGEKTFVGMSELAAVNVAAANKVFKSFDGVLYRVNDAGYYTLVAYPAGKTDASYTVVSKTIKIGAYGFGGIESVGDTEYGANKALSDITLPVHMRVIGASAFAALENMTVLNIKAVFAPTLESYTVDEVNVYDNFNFAYGDDNETLRIFVPANGSGYDNYIWKAYVGKNISATKELHIMSSTLELIERVNAMPTDAAEIATLKRLYNMLNTAQQAIVKGNYDYKDGDKYIDGDYYRALLGGTDYYAKLNSLTARASASASAGASVGSHKAEGSYAPMAVALAIAVAVAVVTAFAAAAVILARRGR